MCSGFQTAGQIRKSQRQSFSFSYTPVKNTQANMYESGTGIWAAHRV